MQPIIKDFDKVVRQERKIMLAGETIDVTKIPSRVALELMQLRKSKKLNTDEGFYELIGLVAKAGQASNKKVTTDWLIDNTDLEVLLDVIEFVVDPIMTRAKDKGVDVDALVEEEAGKN